MARGDSHFGPLAARRRGGPGAPLCESDADSQLRGTPGARRAWPARAHPPTPGLGQVQQRRHHEAGEREHEVHLGDAVRARQQAREQRALQAAERPSLGAAWERSRGASIRSIRLALGMFSKLCAAPSFAEFRPWRVLHGM